MNQLLVLVVCVCVCVLEQGLLPPDPRTQQLSRLALLNRGNQGAGLHAT